MPEKHFILHVEGKAGDDDLFMVKEAFKKTYGYAKISIQEVGYCEICSGSFPMKEFTRVMQLDGEAEDQPIEPITVCCHCFDTEVDAPGWGYSNGYAPMENYRQLKDGTWALRKDARIYG